MTTNPISVQLPKRPLCRECWRPLAWCAEDFWVDADHNQDSDPTDHVHVVATTGVANFMVVTFYVASDVLLGDNIAVNLAEWPTDEPVWYALDVMGVRNVPADENHTDLVRLTLRDPFADDRHTWEFDVLPECVIKRFLELP